MNTAATSLQASRGDVLPILPHTAICTSPDSSQTGWLTSVCILGEHGNPDERTRAGIAPGTAGEGDGTATWRRSQPILPTGNSLLIWTRSSSSISSVRVHPGHPGRLCPFIIPLSEGIPARLITSQLFFSLDNVLCPDVASNTAALMATLHPADPLPVFHINLQLGHYHHRAVLTFLVCPRT